MTTLEEVRTKVIEAVPEIHELQKWCGSPNCLDTNCIECDWDYRPITLADVLRAINVRPAPSLLLLGNPDELGMAHGNEITAWNLANDLDSQSEEVVLFLHSILCGK